MPSFLFRVSFAERQTKFPVSASRAKAKFEVAPKIFP